MRLRRKTSEKSEVFWCSVAGLCVNIRDAWCRWGNAMPNATAHAKTYAHEDEKKNVPVERRKKIARASLVVDGIKRESIKG